MGRAVLIDDNPLCRLGLCELIRAAQPKLTILEFDTFTRARACLGENSDIRLIILNVALSDCRGLLGLLELKSEFPGIPVIALSDDTRDEFINRSVALGAFGYIARSAPCDAINHVLLAALSENGGVSIAVRENQIDVVTSLSPALLRVLMGLKRGMRNKEIAFELGLSEKTIKAYLSILYRKLGVGSRTQALLMLQATHSG